MTVDPATAFEHANQHGLLLYDYDSSPCARRVRITLTEKDLVWDTQIIDLSRLEQRNPEYLKINPNGFVPTLAHGERIIYESNVITEYLDDVFPETPLYPDDPWQLAQVRMWQSAEAAMAKDYRTLMYQRLMGPIVRLTRTLAQALAAARRSTTAPADLAWEERVWKLEVLTPEEEAHYQDRLLKWLDVLEQGLERREFLVGDRFTQAEISVFPRVMMYGFIGLDITSRRYPNVRRWMKQLGRRRSFADTLAGQDRALLLLARTRVLRWLRRVLKKPENARSFLERLQLAVLKRLFERAAASGEVEVEAPGGAEPIRRPCNGMIPPADVTTRRLRPLSADINSRPITLYEYKHSPHARRIRILLLEKGLRWQSVEIDMSRMEHKSPDYLAINPNGEIPAIRHGNRLLYDSQVIAEYLEQIYDGSGYPRLYPTDAYLAAQVRMWLALEAGTHKEFRPLFYLYVIRGELCDRGITAERVEEIVPAGVHPSYKQWLCGTITGALRFDTSEQLAKDIILRKLDMMEEELVGNDYLVGDAFTMADAAWFTRIDLFPVLGIHLRRDRHPNLLRWYGAIGRRSSIVASRRPL